MASSKLSLLGSSIVRSSNLYKTSNLINPTRFPTSLHPWPEWVAFVDHLNSNYHFPNTFSYTDFKLLQTAGIAFAHHRSHLFESLSWVDIKTLVDKRCPNLLRRVVDSAKRLREHLHIKEGLVCDACNLREQCHRSYEKLTDYEASARTVDVVRILLVYALDPSALSEVTITSDRAIIEKSTRRLLSQLIELSDTLPAPEVPISSVPAPRLKRISPPKFDANDWKCSRCNFMNFARNVFCKQCQGEGPKRIDDSVKMKRGEWMCPGCGLVHYASKTSCFRCRVAQLPRQLQPGDWECSSCAYVNFRNNVRCRKCKCDRPRSGETLS